MLNFRRPTVPSSTLLSEFLIGKFVAIFPESNFNPNPKGSDSYLGGLSVHRTLLSIQNSENGGRIREQCSVCI